MKAGTYAIMTPISVPSNRVLRGAGEGVTNLHNRHDGGMTVLLGGAGWFGAYGAGDTGVVALSSGYTKGSTTLVSAAAPASTSAAFAVGAYVAVTENNDPNLVNITGYDGDCNWCGGPWGFGSGTQLMAQIVQVAAISGNTVTIDRPLYYTFTSSLSPVLKPLNLPVVGSEDEIWQLGCKSEVSGPVDPNVLATLFHCGSYSYASNAGASATSGFASSLPGVDGNCSGMLPNSYY